MLPAGTSTTGNFTVTEVLLAVTYEETAATALMTWSVSWRRSSMSMAGIASTSSLKVMTTSVRGWAPVESLAGRKVDTVGAARAVRARSAARASAEQARIERRVVLVEGRSQQMLEVSGPGCRCAEVLERLLRQS